MLECVLGVLVCVGVCWLRLQVWSLRVDISLLNGCGNLVDVCCLAALAALLGFRKPQVEVDQSAGEGEAQVIVHPPEVSSFTGKWHCTCMSKQPCRKCFARGCTLPAAHHNIHTHIYIYIHIYAFIFICIYTCGVVCHCEIPAVCRVLGKVFLWRLLTCQLRQQVIRRQLTTPVALLAGCRASGMQWV
jgi:hypothetical protein